MRGYPPRPRRLPVLLRLAARTRPTVLGGRPVGRRALRVRRHWRRSLGGTARRCRRGGRGDGLVRRPRLSGFRTTPGAPGSLPRRERLLRALDRPHSDRADPRGRAFPSLRADELAGRKLHRTAGGDSDRRQPLRRGGRRRRVAALAGRLPRPRRGRRPVSATPSTTPPTGGRRPTSVPPNAADS